MTNFPGASKLMKGGIVLIDLDTAQAQQSIALQYNSASLSLSGRM